MKVPISSRRVSSALSTAMTAPRISRAGLVALGGARGGDILVRTLILLMYGIVITIASTLLAWLSRESTLEYGLLVDVSPDEASCVCKGGSRRDSSKVAEREG
jgi:hypothetical protein